MTEPDGASAPERTGGGLRRPPRRATLLSRTADDIFWLARSMERADFLARIIQATERLAALPATYNAEGSEWVSALESSGAVEAYHAKFDTVTPDQVVNFIAFDVDNPSSIRNCIEAARRNARGVRTALTAEMWDTMNGAWLELRRFEGTRFPAGEAGREEFARFLDFVKQTALAFDGSVYRTMLRDPSYWFFRLGTSIERADNTARILDVKYHVLLPETEAVGGSLDYFQWTAVLRAVSALTAYNWVYRESIKPWLVADLLILRSEMPRSLLYCYENVVRCLESLGRTYGRQGPAQALGRRMIRTLETASIEQIFQDGLHEFVTGFIDDNNTLARTIAEQFLR